MALLARHLLGRVAVHVGHARVCAALEQQQPGRVLVPVQAGHEERRLPVVVHVVHPHALPPRLMTPRRFTQQRPHHIRVAAARGDHHAGVAVVPVEVTADGRVRAPLKQQRDHLVVALVACVHEAAPRIDVQGVDAGATVEQQLGHVQAVVPGGLHERRGDERVGLRLDVTQQPRLGLQQSSDLLHVAPPRGFDHRAPLFHGP